MPSTVCESKLCYRSPTGQVVAVLKRLSVFVGVPLLAMAKAERSLESVRLGHLLAAVLPLAGRPVVLVGYRDSQSVCVGHFLEHVLKVKNLGVRVAKLEWVQLNG